LATHIQILTYFIVMTERELDRIIEMAWEDRTPFIEGDFHSFFGFWKKCKKELKQ